MIIISQDKYNILNFNTTVNIGVEEISTLSDVVQISAQTSGNTVILGSYATQERAKEVLREIAEIRAITEIYKCCNNEVQNIFDKKMLKEKLLFDTYEMPEE